MSIRCQVTNKRVMTGNNVSHSNKKTKRVFKPNLHKKAYWAQSLGRKIILTVSKKGMKTIDKLGIDSVVAIILARGEKI
jgi:large subunit ribosomal protein L28